MANYYSFTKSNYFRCNNEEGLRDLIADCFCGEDTLSLFEKDSEDEKFFAFGTYDSIGGIKDENGDYNYDLFLARLQELLPDGEAVIITEVGHMKLADVYGRVDIITNKEIRFESLCNIGAKMARSLLDNPNWVGID